MDVVNPSVPLAPLSPGRAGKIAVEGSLIQSFIPPPHGGGGGDLASPGKPPKSPRALARLNKIFSDDLSPRYVSEVTTHGQNNTDQKNEDELEVDPQKRAKATDVTSPRIGKDGEWKRKALAGKGIVRDGEGNSQQQSLQRYKLPPRQTGVAGRRSSGVELTQTSALASSKSDSWKLKALTGRGVIPAREAFDDAVPSPPAASSPLLSVSAPPTPTMPIQSLYGCVSDGEAEADTKNEKHWPKGKDKDKRRQKVSSDVGGLAAVSLPQSVVKRVHVDKDSLAQDMDGVLRALQQELERLGPRDTDAPAKGRGGSGRGTRNARGGGLRHRRSKSIDQLTQITIGTSSPPASPSSSSSSSSGHDGKGAAPAFVFPMAIKVKKTEESAAAGKKSSKTSSLRQQLLLGKGVANPQDKRIVPVSRLSVLIDMADMQAIQHERESFKPAYLRTVAMSRPDHTSGGGGSPSMTKEDLARQRLKTVKAVIASAMDEIQDELQRQSTCRSVSSEELFIGKLDRLSELLA